MSMQPPPPPPPLPPHPDIRYHPYEYNSPQNGVTSPPPPPPQQSPYNSPYSPYNGQPPQNNFGPSYNNNNNPPPPPPSNYSSYTSPPPTSYNAAPNPQQIDNRVSSPMPAPRPVGTSNPAVDLEGLANLSLNQQPGPPRQNVNPNPPPQLQPYGGFAGGFAVASSQPGGNAEDIMESIRRVGSVAPTVYSSSSGPPQAQAAPVPLTSADGTPVLPVVKDLLAAAPVTPAGQVAWCRDAVYLIERGTPHAESLSARATNMLTALGPSNPEAVYLRACLSAPTNPRQAFRDFEGSARAGWHIAWFRLGRDYEQFGDNQHAKECFERGVKLNVTSCIYRMGMANLLGQLGVQVDAIKAMELLRRAADGATMYTPEPAYVYALVLMSEFTPPAPFVMPNIALPPNPLLTAKPYLVKAAQLHFPPAQYKLAHAHEFATYPFTYDALLSVEYYSKASQAGEREADMALSKWFLCGAEGAFERDEGLARVFAERAAAELPSAMFAMGYYEEVGVGGPVNLTNAKEWYKKAAERGNKDAKDRLTALDGQGQGMGREEHEKVMGDTLVRTRTNARMKAHNAQQQQQQQQGLRPKPDVVALVRKNTLEASPPIPSMPPPNTMPPAHHSSTLPPQGPAHAPVHQSTLPPPQQQMPGRQRFSLADPGAGRNASQSPSRPGAGRMQSGPIPQRPSTGSPSGSPSVYPARLPAGPAGGPGVPAGVANTPQPQTAPPPKKPGPTTFAEMGIAAGKVEEEKCVVM